jgi:hypothetical protein
MPLAMLPIGTWPTREVSGSNVGEFSKPPKGSRPREASEAV